MGSESAKELSRLLDVKRVKPDGNYVPKIGHTVVNWGSSRKPNWYDRALRRDVTILNKPDSVKKASNKLTALQVLQDNGVNVPKFTTDKRVAKYWLDDGHTVVERHILNSNCAQGVRIVNLDDEDMPSVLNNAPLYTKFIPKSREFRVHVFNGKVIDYIEKKRMNKERRPENFNKYLCSNEMGWVFCRNNIKHIDSVKTEAIKAVNALGLDFSAVDVIYHNETAYILEANTAPGIMGITLGKYVNAVRSFVGLPDVTFTRDYDNSPNGEDPTLEIDNTSFGSVVAESNVNDFSGRDPELSETERAALDGIVKAQTPGKITLELDRDLVKSLISALNRQLG